MKGKFKCVLCRKFDDEDNLKVTFKLNNDSDLEYVHKDCYDKFVEYCKK